LRKQRSRNARTDARLSNQHFRKRGNVTIRAREKLPASDCYDAHSAGSRSLDASKRILENNAARGGHADYLRAFQKNLRIGFCF